MDNISSSLAQRGITLQPCHGQEKVENSLVQIFGHHKVEEDLTIKRSIKIMGYPLWTGPYHKEIAVDPCVSNIPARYMLF